jgi:hypothetical protein
MAVTELRVHGVGGSTPEQVLNSGPATRIAGDGDAGFYVATDPTVEAYCWGNLTSGAAVRALWLLMLPFTLVNASFWMGPRRRLNEGLVRLLALSLTATAVLAAEGVGTDLLGWQCAARASCRDRHTWLRFLGNGVMATPGRRAAVGAAVPLAALGLLWFLARRAARFEKVEPAASGGGAPLEDPAFWYGARQVDRLRQLHLAVGLAVIGLGMAWPLWDWDRHHHSTLRVVDAGLVLLLWLAIVVAGIAVWIPSVVRRDPPGVRGVEWTKRVQQGSVLLVVGAVLAAVLPARAGWVDHAAVTLPGYGTAVTTVFLAQLAGVAVLALVVARRRDRQAAAGGFAQPVFGALGLLFASVFTAGLAFRMADWLDGGKNPTEGPLHVPVAYEWAAVGLLAVAVPGGVLLALSVRHRYLARRAVEVDRVRQDYEQPKGLDDRVGVVARTRALAGLTDAAVGWVAWLTAASLVAAVTSMTLTLVTGDAPGHVADTSGVLRFATLSGTWLVSGFAAALIVVGYRSYRTASLRKTVGILWDLGTFWPRAAHPLAPPCYAERCVPDLTLRVRYLVARDGGAVVSAHSQGTVLAAALAWQLPPEVLDRVRVITYGSPIARLYGVVYSCWFGPTQVQELQGRIGAGHWVNLWRRTDPIGGPVGTPADDELPHDPDRLDRNDGDPGFLKPHGHFDYELTDDYARALARLKAAL